MRLPEHGDAADIGSLQRIKVRPAELAAKLRTSFAISTVIEPRRNIRPSVSTARG
jgi:hypothetical protein